MSDLIGEAVAVMLLGLPVTFACWLSVGVVAYLYYGIEGNTYYHVVDDKPYPQTRQMGRRVASVGTVFGTLALVLGALYGVGRLFLLAVTAL